MSFTERLKTLRQEKKHNQKDLAILLNITQTQFSYYEKGKSVPPLQTLIILSDFFGVSTDYLLDRSDDPRREEFSAESRARRTSLKVKEQALLAALPTSLLPAYQAAKEKNPENLPQIIETFAKMAKDYHSLTK